MDKTRGIAAVILAAGFSSRMGDFKPLLKLGPVPAIAHAVRCFLQAGIGDIRVVAGYRADVVMEAVKPLGVKTVLNPRFEEGMYSSIQAGVGALGREIQAFFLLPVDHPLVMATTVERLLNAYHSGQKSIVYPTFQGKRGHPPLIAASYAGEILQDPAPDGLRGLLRQHEDDAMDVEVADEAVLLDMDVPKDYQNLLDYFGSRAVPTQAECQNLLREAGVATPIWEHCHRVAGLAAALARSLNEAGGGLDVGLVLAGGLLHDVAREQPGHAEAGARFLEAKGYPRVAAIVAVHMDIEVAIDALLTEAEVVYLADKMVKGKAIVPIPDRLAAVQERFKGDPQAQRAAESRLEQAAKIKEKVEKVLGAPIETVRPLDFGERGEKQ